MLGSIRPNRARHSKEPTARAIALVREALEAGGDDWDRNIRRLEHVLRLLEEELGDAPMVATKSSSPQHVEQGIGSQRRLMRRGDETTGGVVKRFSFAHMPRADALSELKRFAFGDQKLDKATEDMLVSLTAPQTVGPDKDGTGLRSFARPPSAASLTQKLAFRSAGAPASAAAPPPATAARSPLLGWLMPARPADGPSAQDNHGAARAQLREATLDWTYDVEQLDVATEGHCLTCLFDEVLSRHGLIGRLAADGLAVDVPKLGAFLRKLEATYAPPTYKHGVLGNPYHNRKHAADVTLGVHRFLIEPAGGSNSGSPPALSLAEAAGLSALDVFGALFAAAVHDYAHPGTGNAHEIKLNSPLALRFHDVPPPSHAHSHSHPHSLRLHDVPPPPYRDPAR